MIKKNLKLSIIIPTYNEASTIKAAIKHLNALNAIHEIIVVDGGSADGTPDLCSNEIKFIQAPKGRAVQMNAGALAASGEIFLFLHSDTKLPGNCPQQIETALSNENVVGGAFKVRFDHPGLFFYLAALGSNIRAAITGIYFGDQAIFVRRKDFFQVGGYPPVELMEDWIFSRKLRLAGKTVLLSGSVITSARRWLTYGKWRTAWLMLKIKFLYLIGVSPSILKRMYSDRDR